MVARCERVVQWDFQIAPVIETADWRGFGLATCCNGRFARAWAAVFFGLKHRSRRDCGGYSAGAARPIRRAWCGFARSDSFTISIPTNSTAATKVVTTQSVSVNATVWKATCRNGT